MQVALTKLLEDGEALGTGELEDVYEVDGVLRVVSTALEAADDLVGDARGGTEHVIGVAHEQRMVGDEALIVELHEVLAFADGPLVHIVDRDVGEHLLRLGPGDRELEARDASVDVARLEPAAALVVPAIALPSGYDAGLVRVEQDIGLLGLEHELVAANRVDSTDCHRCVLSS